MNDKRKAALYKAVKIGGMLSFIPLVLAAGPVAGYVAGKYLEERFGLPGYVSLVLILIGLAGSVMEIARIIKFALRTESK